MIGAELEGVEELQKKLDRLVKQAPKKVVSSALRKSAKRTKPRILSLISGAVLNIRTGDYFKAWARSKIRSAGRLPGGFVRVGIVWPTRQELGISPDDKYFYPTALEYGTKDGRLRARPHLRPAIDNYKSSEYKAIAKDIKQGIEKEAMRK